MLKNEHKALYGAKKAAEYKRLKTSNDKHILAFHRQKADEEIIYIANMSDQAQKFTVDVKKNMVKAMSGNDFKLSPNKEFEFKPWEYTILKGK